MTYMRRNFLYIILLYTEIELCESKLYFHVMEENFIGSNATSFDKLKGDFKEIECETMYRCKPEYIKNKERIFHNIYKVECDEGKCNLFLVQIPIYSLWELCKFGMVLLGTSLIFFVYVQ